MFDDPRWGDDPRERDEDPREVFYVVRFLDSASISRRLVDKIDPSRTVLTYATLQDRPPAPRCVRHGVLM